MDFFRDEEAELKNLLGIDLTPYQSVQCMISLLKQPIGHGPGMTITFKFGSLCFILIWKGQMNSKTCLVLRRSI